MRQAIQTCCGIVLGVAQAGAQNVGFYTAPLLPQAGRLVFDSRRNVAVVIENDRMWDWDGTSFRQRLGQSHYLGWGTGPAAYDPHRGEIHHGQINGIATWDGASWQSSPTPTGWSLGSMAFDAVRRRLVRVFTNGPDVAEWDGVSWSRTTPPSSPGVNGLLVFDPSRGRCVLATGDPVTLWSWDGMAWTLVSGNGPTTTGSPRVQFAHDPAGSRLVLTIGVNTALVPLATWAFGAAGWTPIATPAVFSNQSVNLTFDGTGILRLGAVTPLPEGLWRLEGNVWRPIPIVNPRTRFVPGVASSPNTQQIVMFGGVLYSGAPLDDTWMFDGAWHRQTPTQSPPPRYGAGFAWSFADQDFVLFGGRDAQNGYLADTWTWDGTSWTQHQPATVPAARSVTAMALDPNGGVLLYGGIGNGNPAGDVWRWLGGNWQNLGAAPVVALYPMACHDLVRSQTVVVAASQTLLWDGAAWTQGPNLPFWTLGLNVGLAWRHETQTVLCYEQQNGVVQAAEWNGSQWTTLSPTTPGLPYQPLPPLLATDWRNLRVVSLQHNYTSTDSRSDLAVFTTAPATATRFGNGCALGATPGLTVDGRPRPDQSTFAIEAATFAPNAPCVFAIGFVQQSLPLGAGCVVSIAQAPAVSFLVADPAGRLREPLPIPADPSLRGVTLLAQAAVVDPARSPIGSVTLTEGLRITIGD